MRRVRGSGRRPARTRAAAQVCSECSAALGPFFVHCTGSEPQAILARCLCKETTLWEDKAMGRKYPWWRMLVAAMFGGLIGVAVAGAAGEQFLPALGRREGALRFVGIPQANGYIDYLTFLNERDGGINGVKLVWEECETVYDVPRSVEYYERLKAKGPTGAAVFHPMGTPPTYALLGRATHGRYLTDDVVKSLLESPEDLKLGGERRKITLVMSDLRGFTSMAGRLAPEQVMTMVNRYLGTMIEVIQTYQGTIDEFIGDAIFTLF